MVSVEYGYGCSVECEYRAVVGDDVGYGTIGYGYGRSAAFESVAGLLQFLLDDHPAFGWKTDPVPTPVTAFKGLVAAPRGSSDDCFQLVVFRRWARKTGVVYWPRVATAW